MPHAQQLLRELVEERRRLVVDLEANLASIDSKIEEVAGAVDALERRLRLLDAPPLMSVTAIARYLRVSKHTVYAWLREGTLPAKVTDRGQTVVLKEDVDAWRRSLPPSKRVHREFPSEDGQSAPPQKGAKRGA